MRNRKVTVAARSKCTSAGWWRWALLDRLHGSTGLRANFGSTVMDTIRRQCHRAGQLHYFLPFNKFSRWRVRWSARRSACNAPQEISWNWIAFWPSAVRCFNSSVSQSVIYFTVPPRAAVIPPRAVSPRSLSVPQDRISSSRSNFGQHRPIMDIAQSHSHTKKFRSPLLSFDKN